MSNVSGQRFIELNQPFNHGKEVQWCNRKFFCELFKVMFAVAVIISEHERESSVDAMIRKIASQRRDLGLQHYLWVEFVGSVLCYEMFFPHFALKRKATFDLL